MEIRRDRQYRHQRLDGSGADRPSALPVSGHPVCWSGAQGFRLSDAPEEFAVGVLERRAPYGDSPVVGERGTKTQQRILRAALAVFDEVGYHDCSVDRIAASASCSRPSFYQYFSTKEDLFGHLVGELSRRIGEITHSMDRITPDQEGWESIYSWVIAFGEIYDVFRPVFAVFEGAVAEDPAVGLGAERFFDRQAADLLSHIDRRAFRLRRPQVIVALLFPTVARTFRYRQLLGGTSSGIGALGRDRVERALTDVLHRTFVGQLPGVNVRPHIAHGTLVRRATPRPYGPVTDSLTPAGRKTRTRLLEAARRVITARGYHDARVDDIVELAETSHGTFYRYFDNKEELFRVLAGHSEAVLTCVVDDLPEAMKFSSASGGSAGLRRWVRRYLEVFAAEGPVLQAWLEGMWVDRDLRLIARSEIETLWLRLAGFLDPRDFGDVDSDALVLLSLLDRVEPKSGIEGSVDPAVVIALSQVLTRGFLLRSG